MYFEMITVSASCDVFDHFFIAPKSWTKPRYRREKYKQFFQAKNHLKMLATNNYNEAYY